MSVPRKRGAHGAEWTAGAEPDGGLGFAATSSGDKPRRNKQDGGGLGAPPPKPRKGNDAGGAQQYRPKGDKKKKQKAPKPEASIGNFAQDEQAQPERWYWRWMKITAVVLFALGYCALAGYFIYRFMTEETIEDRLAEGGAACENLNCPYPYRCVVSEENNTLARCGGSNSSATNTDTIQLILGLILGVPAFVCVPCTLHWILRVGWPSLFRAYEERERKKRALDIESIYKDGGGQGGEQLGVPQEMLDLEEGELDPGMAEPLRPKGLRGRLPRFLQGMLPLPRPQAQKPAKAPGPPAASLGAPSFDQSNDDELAELFASTSKAKKEATQPAGAGGDADDLDVLFASQKGRPKVDDDEVLDALFAKAPRRSLQQSQAGTLEGGSLLHPATNRSHEPRGSETGSFSALFHTPARGAAPPSHSESRRRKKKKGRRSRSPEPAPRRASPPARRGKAAMPAMREASPGIGGAEARTPSASAAEDSGGLSGLFGVTGRAPSKRRGRAAPSGVFSEGIPESSVALSYATGATSRTSAEPDEESDDGGFVDGEEGPDFFGYALHLAGGDEPEDEDEAQQAKADVFSVISNDSLKDLEPAPLSELFHPPLA